MLAIAKQLGYIVTMLLMHGNEWSGQDVSGWWISEKFDGWRAIWTGGRLESRQEKPYDAPNWFLRGLPQFPLDCELWLGRGKTCADVAKAVQRGNWADLRLVIFDIPEPGCGLERNLPRLSKCRLPAHVSIAIYTQTTSTEAAVGTMKAIAKLGGEGVMVRRPWSAYQTYRTDDLLKIKP